MDASSFRLAESASKPQPGRQVQRWLVDTRDPQERLGYLLFLPRGYDNSTQQWPFLLFLHGAGERGSNLKEVKSHGPPRIVESTPDFPFIMVAPQCPHGRYWVESEMQIALLALVDLICEEFSVDTSRLYLTGISMGGFGAWALAAASAQRWAAIVPICGGGTPRDAERLKETPIWAFHGQRDNVVPVEYSIEMVQAVRRHRGNVQLTIYPQAGHDSWTETYERSDLYDWLLSHRKEA